MTKRNFVAETRKYTRWVSSELKAITRLHSHKMTSSHRYFHAAIGMRDRSIKTVMFSVARKAKVMESQS